MAMDQRQLESIARISQDLEEALSLLEESPNLYSIVSASSLKTKESLMQLSTELCQQSALFSTIVRSMVWLIQYLSSADAKNQKDVYFGTRKMR